MPSTEQIPVSHLLAGDRVQEGGDVLTVNWVQPSPSGETTVQYRDLGVNSRYAPGAVVRRLPRLEERSVTLSTLVSRLKVALRSISTSDDPDFMRGHALHHLDTTVTELETRVRPQGEAP